MALSMDPRNGLFLLVIVTIAGGGAVDQWSTFPAVSDVNVTGFDIIGGGAGFGMNSIGNLNFIDNLATPAAAVSLYSDGTDLFANTGGDVKNLSDIGIVTGLTADRILISNGSGDLVVSPITSGELANALTGYPAGDSVDTRLDALEASVFDPLNIDSDLIPTPTNLRNIGSSVAFWTTLFVNRVRFGDSTHFIENISDDMVYETESGRRHSFTVNGTQEMFIDATGVTINDNLIIQDDLTVQDDVTLGFSGGDELTINATLVSDLNIENGNEIKPDSGQIGIFVNDFGSIGTFGSLGIPFDPNFESTAAAADTDFGDVVGSIGVYGRAGGTPLLVVKTVDSPSTWRGVLLNNITLT